jgi:hypothetical protein
MVERVHGGQFQDKPGPIFIAEEESFSQAHVPDIGAEPFDCASSCVAEATQRGRSEGVNVKPALNRLLGLR